MHRQTSQYLVWGIQFFFCKSGLMEILMLIWLTERIWQRKWTLCLLHTFYRRHQYLVVLQPDQKCSCEPWIQNSHLAASWILEETNLKYMTTTNHKNLKTFPRFPKEDYSKHVSKLSPPILSVLTQLFYPATLLELLIKTKGRISLTWNWVYLLGLPAVALSVPHSLLTWFSLLWLPGHCNILIFLFTSLLSYLLCRLLFLMLVSPGPLSSPSVLVLADFMAIAKCTSWPLPDVSSLTSRCIYPAVPLDPDCNAWKAFCKTKPSNTAFFISTRVAPLPLTCTQNLSANLAGFSFKIEPESITFTWIVEIVSLHGVSASNQCCSPTPNINV